MTLPNELQMEYGGSFLRITSELEDVGWFSYPLGLCYCYLNTIEVARPIKDHMNRISAVASNYSQCPELL